MSGANLSGALSGAWRPNRIGKGTVANPTIDLWFDPSAFVAPAPYTFGNSGRNILRGPGFKNVDLSGWASMYSKETLLGWAQMREGMNDELQGELLARQWLINIACGIPLSIWYDWHDDGPNPRNPEHNCGLVRYPYHEGQDPVYTPKPAYWAARALAEVLKGYRFERTLSVGRPGDYVLAFRKQRTTRLVAWTVAGSPGAVSIPVEKGPCFVVGHKGESKGTLPVADGKVALQLTSAPQYLVCGSARSPAVVTD